MKCERYVKKRRGLTGPTPPAFPAYLPWGLGSLAFQGIVAQTPLDVKSLEIRGQTQMYSDCFRDSGVPSGLKPLVLEATSLFLFLFFGKTCFLEY